MLAQQVEPPQGGQDCQNDAALLPPAQSPYLADSFLQPAGCDLQFADDCPMQQNNYVTTYRMKTEPSKFHSLCMTPTRSVLSPWVQYTASPMT